MSQVTKKLMFNKYLGLVLISFYIIEKQTISNHLFYSKNNFQ